jgi:apolipoprotein N-acyltransferase
VASGRPRLPLALGALALSALCQWFGSGLHPTWFLAWIAPVPLLVAAPRLGPGAAFGMGAAAHAIGDLNTWAYASIVPLPLHLLILLAPALAWGASVALFRRFVLQERLGPALIALPVAWTAFQYLWQAASPHGTFFDLAYTQMDFRPALQIASLTGHLGIGFCLLLAASALALALVGGPTPAKRPLIAAALLVVAADLGYGLARASSEPAGPSVRIGLIASDVPGNLGARQPQASEALFRIYLSHVPELVAKGAGVVVMPEHLGAFVDESHGGNAARLDALFGQAAKENRVYLLVGVDALDAGGLLRNQSRLYAPDGRLAGVYNKHHLLPGPESVFLPGSRTTVVRTPEGDWGLEICKDMDFPALSRDYGRAGVGLLLVPALDFAVDGWLHGRMAVLRGVESGFSVARAAAFGRLTLSDDRGRVLAESDTGVAPFAEVVGPVPVRHDPTLYDRLGDWFAWLDGAGLACLLALCARPRETLPGSGSRDRCLQPGLP